TTIRELFRKLPKVKHLDEQAGMKGVHEAIDSVISLAIKAGLEKETMSLSLRKLTKPVIYGFFNDYESKQLSDLSAYLKKQAKFIDWYNELVGDEATAHKDTSSKPERARQKLHLVSALYSDASESEDKNDEIIIDAEIEGHPVPMLFDPGAKKNLLPAKQFKSPTMVMPHDSVTVCAQTTSSRPLEKRARQAACSTAAVGRR